MILERRKNVIILNDGIGQLLSTRVVMDHLCFILTQVNSDEFAKLPQGNKDTLGMPRFFMVEQIDSDTTKFIFYPAADNKYQITIDYFPPAKRA